MSRAQPLRSSTGRLRLYRNLVHPVLMFIRSYLTRKKLPSVASLLTSRPSCVPTRLAASASTRRLGSGACLFPEGSARQLGQDQVGDLLAEERAVVLPSIVR